MIFSNISNDAHTAAKMGASFAETKAFITSLNVLQRRKNSVSLKLSALAELAKLPRWAHAASLPTVFLSLRRSSTRFSSAAMSLIVEPMLEQTDTTVVETLATAVSALITKDVRDALADLDKAALSCMNVSPTNESFDSYFSLNRYPEVFVILATLEVLAAEASRDVTDFLERSAPDRQDIGALTLLLDQAIGMKFGLQQQLCAVDCLTQLGEDRRAREVLRSIPVRFKSEPSVLSRFATLHGATSMQPLSEWATKELVLYSGLRDVLGHEFSNASDEERRKILSSWQDAVLQVWLSLADTSDDASTRNAFGKFVQPRLNRVPKSLALDVQSSAPYLDRDIGPIYLLLLREAGETINSVKIGTGQDACTAAAPRYHLRPRAPGQKWRRTQPFPSLLIRMSAWALAACDILRDSRNLDVEDESIRNISTFLFHVYHWMHRYFRSLSNNEKTSPTREGQLILSAFSIVQQTIGGRFVSPSPRFFAQIALRCYRHGFVPENGTSHDENRFMAEMGWIFSASFQLIQNAITRIEVEYRFGRWFEVAGELTSEYFHFCETYGQSDEPTLFTAELISRQFGNSETGLRSEVERVLAEAQETGSWKGALKKHRSVLLAESTSYRDWDKAKLEIPTNTDRGLAAYLSIATQRIAAAHDDSSTPLDLKQVWFEEFQKLLVMTRGFGDFDRFLQLRLVQLLRNGVFLDTDLQDTCNLRELVRSLVIKLIEFGANQTFRRLQQWFLEDLPRTQEDADLRLALFKAISQYAEFLDASPLDENRATDLFEREQTRARALSLERFKTSILVGWAGDEIGLVKPIMEGAKRITELKRRPQLPLSCSVETIDWDEFDRPLRISSRAGFNIQTSEIIVPDLHSGTITATSLPPQSKFGRNLYAGAEVSTDEKSAYVGILGTKGVQEASISPDGKTLVKVSGAVDGDIPAGALVSAKHSRIVDGELDSLYDVTAVSALGPGESGASFVSAVPTGELGARRLLVDVADQNEPIDLTELTPNFLFLFSYRDTQARKFSCNLAWQQNDRTYLPQLGAFSDLVLEVVADVGASETIVLCVQSVELGPLGEPSHLIVETEPLNWFRVDLWYDCTRHAGEELTRSIKQIADYEGSYDKAEGLLLAVRVIVEKEEVGYGRGVGPKLELGPSGRVAANWTKGPIASPFDDRNLTWRRIFDPVASEHEDSVDLEVVNRGEGRFLAKLSQDDERVIGFPDHLELVFDPAVDKTSVLQAELNRRRRGNPHKGQLSANGARNFALKFDSMTNADRADFLRWLTDDQDQFDVRTLELKWVRPDGINQFGYVTGFTDQDLRLDIFAESLTLQAISSEIEEKVRRTARGRKVLARPNIVWTSVVKIDAHQLPEEAFEDDMAIGVVVKTAGSSGSQGKERSVFVAWRNLLEAPPSKLELFSEAGKLKFLPQGTRVRVDRRGHHIRCSVEHLSVTAEALWQKEPYQKRHEYAGTAQQSDGKWVGVYEARPGVLSLLDAEDRESELVRRLVNQLGADKGFSVSTTRQRESVQFRGLETSRISLQSENGKLPIRTFTGLSNVRSLPTGKVSLVGIDLALSPAKMPGCFRIRRLLHVQDRGEYVLPAFITGAGKKTADAGKRDGSQDAPFEIDSLIGTDVRGIFEKGGFVPAGARLRRELTDGVAILPSEISHLSPFDFVPVYSRRRQARIRLLQVDSARGSFTQTEPLGPKALYRDLDEPEFGDIVTLRDLALYYVGVEAQEPYRHMFEWGYGLWTALEPDEVQLKSRSLRTRQLSLTFGDRVRKLIFENQGGKVVLNILESDDSSARVLFEQSKRRIHHLLHVTLNPKEGDQAQPKITKVEAYNGSRHNSMLSPFRAVTPKLARNTARELQKILAKEIKRTGKSETIIINARVDSKRFRNSQGRDLVYEAVRIGGKANNGFDGLQKGDRIFVEAGKIRKGKNDVFLELSPLSHISSQLVDPQFYNEKANRLLQIPRRRFSHDEYKLAQLLQSDWTILEGSTLLAYVAEVRSKRIELSLVDDRLHRDSSVLNGLLARQSNRLVVIFVRYRGERNALLLVELHPGVLVQIRSNEIVFSGGDDDSLMRGDLLAIERLPNPKGKKRFRAELAMRGDRHYLRQRRPVVALPTNALGRYSTVPANEGQLQRFLSGFTIGDFRQVKAEVDLSDVSSGLEDSFAQLSRLMETKHPKLAWLQEGESRRRGQIAVRFEPDYARTILAGCLRIEGGDGQASLSISATPLGDWGAELADLQVDWTDITHSFGSAREIAYRISALSWSYHDDFTIVWNRKEGGEMEIDAGCQLGRHSIETGPLFFERHGETASLRLSNRQSRERVLGFANMRDQLPSTGSSERASMVVAGHIDGTGLIVESLPGRFFELSGSLAQHDAPDPITLERLDWNTFGVGDLLFVSRQPNDADPFSQELVAFDWRHGVQNAFGPRGSVLPQTSTDEHQGYVSYGAGDFTLKVPCNRPTEMPQLILAGGTQPPREIELPQQQATDGDEIERQEPYSYLIGCTVLLEKDSLGQVVLSGLNQFIAQPARETCDGKTVEWEKDGLLANIFDDQTGTSSSESETARVKQAIDAAGGALPVTVERIETVGDGRCVLFSRRYQAPLIRNESVGRATVERLSDDMNDIIMAIGGRHFVVPIGQFVQGAPEDLIHLIVNHLSKSKRAVWVRLTPGGYRIGMPKVSGQQVLIRAIEVVSQETVGEEEASVLQQIHGLVCEGADDHRLYWLPYCEIGAARPSLTECQKYFLRRDVSHIAKILPSTEISLIQHEPVSAELKRLSLGSEFELLLLRESLEDSEGSQAEFLAKTVNSGLLLTVTSLSDRSTAGQEGPIRVEVSRRSVSPDGTVTIQAVPRGQSRLRYDLPAQLKITPETSVPSDQPLVFGAAPGPELMLLIEGENETEDERIEALCYEFLNQDVISLQSILALLDELLGSLEPERSARRRGISWRVGREIYVRALRSFHLEPIARRHAEACRGRFPDNMDSAVSNRADEIFNLVGANVKSSKIPQLREKLENFLRFVNFYPVSGEDKALAYATIATFGYTYDLDSLIGNAPILSRITVAARVCNIDMDWTLTSGLFEQLKYDTGNMREILRREDLDIPLQRGFA